MNENEEDLEWHRPRSHSLPNMVFTDMDGFDDDFEDDSLDVKIDKKDKRCYQF